jgi:hypothetical protein
MGWDSRIAHTIARDADEDGRQSSEHCHRLCPGDMECTRKRYSGFIASWS